MQYNNICINGSCGNKYLPNKKKASARIRLVYRYSQYKRKPAKTKKLGFSQNKTGILRIAFDLNQFFHHILNPGNRAFTRHETLLF